MSTFSPYGSSLLEVKIAFWVSFKYADLGEAMHLEKTSVLIFGLIKDGLASVLWARRNDLGKGPEYLETARDDKTRHTMPQ